MQQPERRSLLSLYFAYFVDYFSWGLSVAFLYVYISDPQSPFQHLFCSRQTSLAIALAAFPIGEVIGSPILGDLSDWMGRKKILIWGLWGSLFSLILSTFCLLFGNFPLFIAGQLLLGFFSGKQAMTQAAIVEFPSFKGQKLAFLSVLGGVAWTLSPFLGEALLKEPFRLHGGFIWPTILACASFILALFFIQLFFIDSYRPSRSLESPQAVWQNIGSLFFVAWREKLFFLFILNLLGWYLLAISLSDFLIFRFHLTEAQIGHFNHYLSFCFTLGGILGTAWILYRWKAKNLLFWMLLAGSIGLFFLVNVEKIGELWTYLAIPAITEAWIYPAYQTVLSDHTSPSNQGKLFGLIGASNGACQFLAAAILGSSSGTFSILTAALLFLASAAFFPLALRKKPLKATQA